MQFKTHKKTVLSAFISIILFSFPLYALPPEIINAVKPSKVLEISKSNIKDILRLRSKANLPNYVKLYLEKDDLNIELKGIILEYVNAGHGLEISGPGFASYLFPFLGVEGKTVPCAGEFEANQATYHPILTDVKKVELACGCSSSAADFIFNNPDVFPLLKDKNGACAAIAFKYGIGRVVAFGRPLKCIPDIKNSGDARYDTYRFAINIDQWLSGFPVPGTPFLLHLHLGKKAA
jgi:hypothetical protein